MAYFSHSGNALLFEAAVTGTHASGKTTLVESFIDPELTQAAGLESYGQYGASLVDMASPTGDNEPSYQLPFITVGEAALQFAEEAGDPSLLAGNYSFATQKAIESLHIRNMVKARLDALPALMTFLRRELPGEIANAAVILSDRTYLDGKAYSATRTPEDDQDVVEEIPLRGHEWFMVHQTDAIFICDHREIPFIPGQARSADEQLRDQVADRLMALYRLAPNEPVELTGPPAQRHNHVAGYMIRLIQGNLSHDERTPLLAEEYLLPWTEEGAQLRRLLDAAHARMRPPRQY